MSVQKLSIKNYNSFQGVDFSKSDISRPSNFLSDSLNDDIGNGGGTVQRPGTKFVANPPLDFVAGPGNDYRPKLRGLGKFNAVNSSSGLIEENLVAVRTDSSSDGLYKLIKREWGVNYSGSDIVTLSFKYDHEEEYQFKAVIKVNGDTTWQYNVGNAKDEAANYLNAATFFTALDSVSGISVTYTSSALSPAAFIEAFDEVHLVDGADYKYFYLYDLEKIPYGGGSTEPEYSFANLYQTPSFSNLRNCLFFTSYQNVSPPTPHSLMKFDGVSYYRAGLPAGGDRFGVLDDEGAAPTTGEVGSGSGHTVGQTYYYKYHYSYKDPQGNYITGNMSPPSSLETVSGTTDINVIVSNLSNLSGFNTRGAKVNGNQSSVTSITVDSGHTLIEGDVAYFYDGVTSAYVEKTITGTTSTSISFSGAVTVSDNAFISANARICIYRTANAGDANSTYYFLAEIPHDFINSNQTWVDNIIEGSEGEDYVVPITSHGLPPSPKYLTTLNQNLICAGMNDDLNGIQWSDIDSPEYFDRSVNQIIVDSSKGSSITGLKDLNSDLFIFKDRSVSMLIGDLNEANFKVQELPTNGVGCVAGDTIQQVGNNILFLSNSGIFAINAQGIVEIGSPINSDLLKRGFRLNASKSVVWEENNKYILSVIKTVGTGTTEADGLISTTNSDHKLYAFDYQSNSWHIWDGINFACGAGILNGELHFINQYYDSNTTGPTCIVGKFLSQDSTSNFNDHNQPINFRVGSPWETIGEPSYFKRFLRLKTYRSETDSVELVEAPYSLSVEQEFNFVSSSENNAFTISFNASTGWDGSGWDSTGYGDSIPTLIQSKLKSLKSRSMRLIFSNSNYNERPIISGLELEIAPSYDLQMKSK